VKEESKMSKKEKSIRASLIANPDAGRPEQIAGNLQLAIRYLKKNGLKVDMALAKPKEEATPLTRQAVKDGHKLVVALGGDSTLEDVICGMVGSKARLGIIPTGIQNNIAKNMGVEEKALPQGSLLSTEEK
jgi:diacylglycerol kinase family enzyme